MSNRTQRTLTTTIVAAALLLIAVGLWLGRSKTTLAATPPLTPDLTQPIRQDEPRPRIDVVFALDTTGSMGGLIAGAKAKIWAIASHIAAGQPTPDLRVGLVAYRDRGDEFVTRTFPLSRDMDEVYANLMSFSANGGGDRPEDVIRALSDTVHTMPWDRSPRTLRLVFLVGDSPAHEDYDGPSLAEVTRQASAAGIVINTIRCGGAADTERMWTSIAQGAGGAYASVAQHGGWQQVDTPYDRELSALNARLSGTFIPYGDHDERSLAEGRMKVNAALAAPAAASSASFRARSKRLDTHDALSVLATGKPLEADKLGDGLAGLSPAKRKEILGKKLAEREELNRKIETLAKQRDAYVKDELKKRGGGGMETEVGKMLHRQAARIGVKY